MSIEKFNGSEPDGHYNEAGAFAQGPKKPRNVLIEKNGVLQPIFSEEVKQPEQPEQVEQPAKTEQPTQPEQVEQASSVEKSVVESKPQEKSAELGGKAREVFEKLASLEDEAKRILKLRKDLGINTRDDERRVEEAEAKLNALMNKMEA